MKERRNYESTNVEKEGKEFDEYARNGNHLEIKILSLEQDFVSREKKRVIFFFLIRVSSSLILVYDSYRKGCKEILVSRVQPTRS